MAWLSVSYNGSPPIQKMVSSTGSPPRQNVSFSGSPPRQNASYHTSPPVQSYSYSGAFPFQSFSNYGTSPLQTFSNLGRFSEEKPYRSPKPIRMVIRSGHDGSPIAGSPEKVSFRINKKPENLASGASSGAKPPAAPRSPKRRRRPKKGKGLWAGGRPCPEPMIAPAALPEWPAIADVRSKLKKLPEGKKEDCREGSKRPDYGS